MRITPLLPLASLVAVPASAQEVGGVTYSRHISPILQDNCVRCHRPNSVAPMSLLTYQDTRRYALRIADRTRRLDRRGAMPPWFVERDLGIQHFANDEALTEEEIALITAWVEAGAPEGDPSEAPEPPMFPDVPSWDIGEPDLVVDLPEYTMEANAPDWWGVLDRVSSSLTEDRYVAAMQVLEISDAEDGVGGNFIFHHAIISSSAERRRGPFWPVHEVGRNAQHFDPEASPLLAGGSEFWISSAHLHANDRTTTAHLRLGFKFHPRDYEPKHRETMLTFGGALGGAPGRAYRGELSGCAETSVVVRRVGRSWWDASGWEDV